MLQPATWLKVTLFRGCFSRFLNCTNGSKSRKAPHNFKMGAIPTCHSSFFPLTFSFLLYCLNLIHYCQTMRKNPLLKSVFIEKIQVMSVKLSILSHSWLHCSFFGLSLFPNFPLLSLCATSPCFSRKLFKISFQLKNTLSVHPPALIRQK